MKSPAEQLRKWREKKGMMKLEAAQMLGVSPMTYGRYESGRVPIDPDVVKRIYKATGVDCTPLRDER